MSGIHAGGRVSRGRPAPPPGPSLKDLNLNSLVALDALLTEGSVTGAARRLGITQSAMSHGLAGLRSLLGDELLVRGQSGMVLTPRARELAAPIRRGLLELERALSARPDFTPGTSRRRFVIAATDFFALAFIPPLLEVLAEEAPHVELEVRAPQYRGYAELLERGEIDLVLNLPIEVPSSLVQQRLFTEDFVCMARRGHPEVGRTLTLETFTRLPHALITPRGEGVSPVDAALARLGKSRWVALRVPYFLVGPLVVARSRLLLTVPRRMAGVFASAYDLVLYEPPLALPTFDVVAVWHERFRRDEGHRYFRDKVVEVAATLTGPLPAPTRSGRRGGSRPASVGRRRAGPA